MSPSAAYPLFREALAGSNLRQALRLARELPTVRLDDAARLLSLMANDEMADAELFERAAVRWLNRFTSEVRGLNLQRVGAAVQALDVLDEDPQALAVLLELLLSRR
jgi:hypothetical protein